MLEIHQAGLIHQLTALNVKALPGYKSELDRQRRRARIGLLLDAKALEPARAIDSLKGFTQKPRKFDTEEVAQAFDLTTHRLNNNGNGQTVYTLRVIGELVCTPPGFTDLINRMSSIVLEIDSIGGSGIDALKMARALRSSGKPVLARIKEASSAAAILSMAAGRREISESGRMTLHPPSALRIGDAGELRKTADQLDRMQAEILELFATATGRPVDEIAPFFVPGMDSHFTPQEALEAGLVNEIIQEKGQT